MKAFIVAAVLVAAVCGQSLDMFKYGQEKSMLLNKQYGFQNELLLKKLGYPVTDKNMMMYGQQDLVDLPMYLQDELTDKKILTIDELYTTQLFKEYLQIPLFREYFVSYPAFQKFVQSIYFQKFWSVPAFKSYFINPVLFYKYVLPIVHLFKYDTSFTLDDQIVNKNVLPFVSGYERDTFVPTVYNKDYLLSKDGLFYKNLLNKVYSNLYNIDDTTTTTTMKKIVDPITGEIKMIPFGVDTIFGDKLVKDVLLKKFLINKNIDIDTIFGDKLIADLLLKKNIDTELLKKIILSKNVDTIDTTIFGDKMIADLLLKKNVDVDLLKQVLLNKNIDVETIQKILLKKMILGDDMITNHMLPEEYLLKEKMMMNKMSPVYERMMYNKQFPTMFNKFDKFETIDTVPQMNLFDLLTKKDLINNKFDKFETIDTVQKMNLFDLLTKKDLINNKFQTIDPVDKMGLFDILTKKDLVIKDKILLNKILADKINEFEKFETVVPKMFDDVTKFERVPLTLEGVKPMMGVRTFDKKFYPEMIKA